MAGVEKSCDEGISFRQQLEEMREGMKFLATEMKSWKENQGILERINLGHGKLDFPVFCSGDPSCWLLRAENYFEFYDTPEEMKVKLASLHFDGDAVQWCQWIKKNRPELGWDEFCKVMRQRFGRQEEEEDVDQALSKIKQNGRHLEEYIREFERLHSRSTGWPDKILRGSFVGGLRGDIKAELETRNPPLSLMDAIERARKIDHKRRQIGKNWGYEGIGNWWYKGIRNWYKGNTNPEEEQAFQANSNSMMPIKKISWEQLQKRKMKGLCFTCDGKFTKDHICKNKRIFVLQQQEGEEGSNIFSFDYWWAALQHMQYLCRDNIGVILGTAFIVGIVGLNIYVSCIKVEHQERVEALSKQRPQAQRPLPLVKLSFSFSSFV